MDKSMSGPIPSFEKWEDRHYKNNVLVYAKHGPYILHSVSDKRFSISCELPDYIIQAHPTLNHKMYNRIFLYGGYDAEDAILACQIHKNAMERIFNLNNNLVPSGPFLSGAMDKHNSSRS